MLVCLFRATTLIGCESPTRSLLSYVDGVNVIMYYPIILILHTTILNPHCNCINPSIFSDAVYFFGNYMVTEVIS